MEAKTSDLSLPSDTKSSISKPSTSTPLSSATRNRDFLFHLEAYLAKRDGVDKVLKIARYASKIILASSALPETHSLSQRLKSFDSSVGVSRKAFRLGKFVQDINALRTTRFNSSNRRHVLLGLIAYGGEGLYYFVEQFIWLAKAGLIDPKHSRNFQKISAWAEFVGFIGSISLKIDDVKKLNKEKACFDSNVEITAAKGAKCYAQVERERALGKKIVMKKLSIVQDLADGLMALADIRDGKGRFSSPLMLSCAGLLSALISTHKNWVSC
ncbi:hypothetical protein Nepgr_018077 [Nepenthes gracilis]|uniref:Peroxisomal membrane protein 11A n=1 Tax=Nepenthes gracilis TaxID=150966 RepID=A0AAD3SU39_NEPGR|nr:hypothetical protein Nepgr_018077 [Nepenthes gracilis]